MNKLDIAIEAVKAGGDFALSLQAERDTLATRAKDASGHDIATEADEGSQERIITVLQQADPHTPIVAEEAEEAINKAASVPTKWVIDPIDGTINYIGGSTFWGATVGYIENGVPTAGVIYLPAQEKLITAQIGQGCHINGQRVSLNHTKPLKETFIGIEYMYWLTKQQRRQLVAVMDKAVGIHALLCATVSAVEVLEGITGAYVHPNPPDIGAYIWDYAAGALAIAEASGFGVNDVARAPDGSTLDWIGSLNMEAVLAASPGLLHEILEVLNSPA